MAEFISIKGTDKGDIKLYALSTCVWCGKTKKFLNDSKVAYSYIDVDLLSEEEYEPIEREIARFNPAGSFPTIIIDSSRCIIGYDPDRLTELVQK